MLYMAYTFTSQCISRLSQDRSSRQGPRDTNESKDHRGALFNSLLSPGFAHPACILIAPKTACQGGTSHSTVGPSTSAINQENTLHSCLQTNLMKAFFSIEVPSSQMTRLYQVDKKLTSSGTEIVSSRLGP